MKKLLFVNLKWINGCIDMLIKSIKLPDDRYRVLFVNGDQKFEMFMRTDNELKALEVAFNYIKEFVLNGGEANEAK